MKNRQCESGQITVMIIAFAVIAALAVGVVVNASSAFLQRRSLAAWADGAALAATQTVDHGRLYRDDAISSLPLSDAGAQRAVASYVGRHELPERFTAFRVDGVAVDRTGGRVTVRLSASVPMLPIAGIGATTITAQASARAPLTP